MIIRIRRRIFHYFSIARYPFYRLFFQFPKVESIEETLQKIIDEKLSIARFGDGELSLLYHNNIGFQNFNEDLKIRLQEIILDYSNGGCLVGIPSSIENLNGFTRQAKMMFRSLIGGYYTNYNKFLNVDYRYPNSFITRFYMDIEDKSVATKYFSLLKEIWENRKVVIIEGEFTRFGIGNDFLSNATHVSRILVPSKNAFDHYNLILNSIIEIVDKNTLILAAIGPTATVLCYDLAKIGYQAIDIGHADIEYEWYLRKNIKKTPIKGKFVNEVKSENPEDTSFDEIYDKQIIKRIQIF